MGDNFLVSGLIVKYVSVNYIKTFQFKMFYHVISTVKMFYRSAPDHGDRPSEVQVHNQGYPDPNEFVWTTYNRVFTGCLNIYYACTLVSLIEINEMILRR